VLGAVGTEVPLIGAYGGVYGQSRANTCVFEKPAAPFVMAGLDPAIHAFVAAKRARLDRLRCFLRNN